MRSHRALISMMARRTSSNQRSDTLMQDRLPAAHQNLLATHGRTKHMVIAQPASPAAISGPFTVPPLPYPTNALEPHMTHLTG